MTDHERRYKQATQHIEHLEKKLSDQEKMTNSFDQEFWDKAALAAVTNLAGKFACRDVSVEAFNIADYLVAARRKRINDSR